MAKRFRCPRILGASLAALVVGCPALAQASDHAASGDIIVPARRTEERLQDAPSSISVLNQTQISARTGYESVQYAPPRMWGVRLCYSFGE